MHARVLFLLLTAQLIAEAEPPLPNAEELKQRAITSYRQMQETLEHYECLVNSQVDELNASGGVKKHKSERREQFFVNGQEINHTLARDGVDLTGNAAKKEQERVDKQVKKYTDTKQVEKAQAEDEKQAEMFIRAQRFRNGHREMRDGRGTIVYDLSGDPAFHPKNIEERVAQAAAGRIWVDEQSGVPVELQIHLDRDIKIGGGLVANLHKGFSIHTLQERESDGVWITKMVEGSGDARAALFLHPRFRFKEVTQQCHLFNVETHESTSPPK
ncbi:MAG TPA: hypothetical protein VH325_09550 [Bryobacteraceae bacterium]|nr:hypothetical protein [Bryobacteraceae bacterium]